MAGLVETVRQARPDLVVPDAFGSAFLARCASASAAWRDVDIATDRFLEHLMREAQRVLAQGM